MQLYSEKPQLPGLSRGTRLLTATVVLSRHGAFPSIKQNVAPFSTRQGLCPFGITNLSSLHLRKGKKISVPNGLHLPIVPKLLKFLHKVEKNNYYGFPYEATVSRMPRTLGKKTWLGYSDTHFYSGGILTLTAIFHLFVFYIT